MDTKKELLEFVNKYTSKGGCQCGKCVDFDADNPKPEGHTVNLTFFEVGLNGEPPKEEFEKLVKELDIEATEKEKSYITLGAQLGDQGFALLTIGLGHLLKVWQGLSPDIVMPFLPKDLKLQMAGSGMVSYKKN